MTVAISIKDLVKVYGIRDIMFYDDNFLLDKKRAIKICEALLTKDYKISWSCLARPEITSDELFGLIKRAGCWQIAYGINDRTDLFQIGAQFSF